MGVKFRLKFTVPDSNGNEVTVLVDALGSYSNYAYLGQFGEFSFAMKFDPLLDEATVRGYFEKKWIEVYYWSPSTNDYKFVTKLYVVEANVRKQTTDTFAITLRCRGIDGLLEAVRLKLPRYYNYVNDLLKLVTNEARNFLIDGINDVLCTTDCASIGGLISFVESISNVILPGAGPLAIAMATISHPNNDPNEIEHLRIDVPDYGTVKFTREAFMKNAACVPITGAQGSWWKGLCNVYTDPDVSTVAHKWHAWSDPGYDLFYNWLFSENAPPQARQGAAGQKTAYSSGHGHSSASGTITFWTAYNTKCCPLGCDTPSKSYCSSSNFIQTLSFPDIAIVKNGNVNVFAGYAYDSKCAWNPNSCDECRSTCRDDKGGCGADILCHIQCWACRYMAALKNGLIRDAINPVFGIMNDVANVLIDINLAFINIITWPIDIVMRFLAIVQTVAEYGNTISACTSRRLAKCSEFCEKWGKLLKYDLEKIVSFAKEVLNNLGDIKIEGIDKKTQRDQEIFFLSGAEIDKPFEGSILNILQALALQNSRVLAFSTDSEGVHHVHFVPIIQTQPLLTLTFCDPRNEATKMAMARVENGEFGADVIKVVSPILSIEQIKNELHEAIKTGKCSLECAPYRYAQLLKGKFSITLMGGTEKSMVVSLDEHPDVARAVLTHSNALLVRIRLPMHPGSPFGDVIGHIPGELTKLVVEGQEKLFYIVDVHYHVGFVELLLVFKDSVASVNVEPIYPNGVKDVCG